MISSIFLTPRKIKFPINLSLFSYASGWIIETHRFHRYQWLPIAAELFVILIITFITVYGNRKHWQERWID